jgi:hypothetical protein
MLYGIPCLGIRHSINPRMMVQSEGLQAGEENLYLEYLSVPTKMNHWRFWLGEAYLVSSRNFAISEDQHWSLVLAGWILRGINCRICFGK